MDSDKVKSFDVDSPPLDELVKVLQDGLKAHFETVQVELVDCPDFKQKPFKIPISGLHGKPVIADVGGGKQLINAIHRILKGQVLILRDHFTSPPVDSSCQSRI